MEKLKNLIKEEVRKLIIESFKQFNISGIEAVWLTSKFKSNGSNIRKYLEDMYGSTKDVEAIAKYIEQYCLFEIINEGSLGYDVMDDDEWNDIVSSKVEQENPMSELPHGLQKPGFKYYSLYPVDYNRGMLDDITIGYFKNKGDSKYFTGAY